MLSELLIQDFAIIDRVSLQFGPGFTVLTGETGAGKSIVVDALSLLLGGRAQTEFVRAGANQARVEGLFHLDEITARAVRPVLEEAGLLDEGEEPATVILAREINASGRSVCRVNGRAVPLKVLQAVGEPLIDIHGQSEHLSLMNPRRHVDMLDRYAGTGALRAQVADRVAALNKVRRQMLALAKDERELAQREDRLNYVVTEIEEAQLKPGEEAAINQERTLLANAEKLATLSGKAYGALQGGDDDDQGALDLLGEVVRSLSALERVDPSLGAERESAEQALYMLQDVARAIGRYQSAIEFNPERLLEIERRLDLFFKLKRKYGATIEEVIAYGEKAKAELDGIANAEERLRELAVIEEKVLRQIGQLGLELSQARRQAALRMAEAIERELGDLRMARAKFTAQILWHPVSGGAIVPDVPEPSLNREDGYAFSETGLDEVEFLLAANPGEPPKPLAKVASGGEAARIMLALKRVLGEVDETPTLIFDEIDTGIGGRVGNVVGRKLYSLGENHQVFCITHLPQIAAFGDAHFHIQKEVIGERTVTRVNPLEGQARIAEIAAMIGGGDTAWETAAEMLNETRMVELNGKV